MWEYFDFNEGLNSCFLIYDETVPKIVQEKKEEKKKRNVHLHTAHTLRELQSL